MLAPMNDKFETKKSLGQHFLNSRVVPGWLCEAGEVTSNDTVLEIGPGTGALTIELLERGAKVIALEADPRAIEVLQEKFSEAVADGRLTIHHTDVRQFEPQNIGLQDHSFKVVANIPYYLTGQLFRTFLDSNVQPTLLVFLVQKEVAKRATTKLEYGEKESLLSLSIKAFGTPKYVKTVGKGHFNPSPKVDSAIIKVADVNREHFTKISPELFFHVLHLGFASKRKQLLGNLSKEYDRTKLSELFSTLDLALDVRGEDVPLNKWFELVEHLVST